MNSDWLKLNASWLVELASKNKNALFRNALAIQKWNSLASPIHS